MSDIQTTNDEYNKAASKIVGTFVGIMALKWIIIIGLKRWARSIK